MAGDDATVTVEFYGTVRDAIGEKAVERDVASGTSVGAALQAIARDHPDLSALLFTSEERLRPHVNISRNGVPVRELDGPETALEPDDTVTVAPSVSGGSGGAR
ncbi:molybdopterin synthase sulfur carrier subunit [Halobacteriales archaeon QS_4_70_19]|nr:MAG: molybdopterin synthase sulfur carrier subunit [Halobacteriales archaeon QS_4_70_19]